MKPKVKEQYQNFINAGVEAQYTMLSLGFELEYQNNMSNTPDQCECDFDDQISNLDFETQYDTDRAYEAMSEATYTEMECSRTLEDFLINYAPTCKLWKSKAYYRLVIKEHLRLCKTTTKAQWRETHPKPKQSWLLHNWKRSRLCGAQHWARSRIVELWTKGQKQRIQNYLDSGDVDGFYDYFNSEYNNTDICSETYRESVNEDISENWEWSDYAYTEQELLENGDITCECGHGDDDDDDSYDRQSLIENIDMVESGTDQSVKGGEIRTIGGLDFDDCMEILGDVLSNFNDQKGGIEVDINCSFHIHAKLGDIKHQYGVNIHRYLYEYLLFNFDALPESVLKRVFNPNRHINPDLSSGKFNLIHFHSQGTIEFRFFGNIDSVSDAAICFDFVRKALVYAFSKKLDDESENKDDTGLNTDQVNNLIKNIEPRKGNFGDSRTITCDEFIWTYINTRSGNYLSIG